MAAKKKVRRTGADRSKRLSDLARERILEYLFDGRLPAGAFVSQNQLVELVDVPVAPLRDALRVLEVEGILNIHPRTGIEFVRPGLDLTRATYQFRSIVEGAAVRIYAETAPDDEVKALRNQHQDFLDRLESGVMDGTALSEAERLEHLLHDSIVGTLKNPLIDTNYKRMRNYLRLVRLERHYTAPVLRRTLLEHMRILDACIAHDADAAEAAVQSHFMNALQRHLGMV